MEETVETPEQIIDELSTMLAESFYQTIRILSDIVAVNERKYYEGSHSRFVSEKSALVAKLLGLSDTEVYEIRVAGLLHDIGKIGFHDNLLQKFTSEMTTQDYELYKTHVKLDWQILSNHSGFDTISKIILQHHERLNGSGFPNKLQGKEILPGAAIIGVVDTFHSSAFKRKSDKSKSINPEEYLKTLEKRLTSAIEFLNQKATSLFDSLVVEVFCNLARQEFGEMIQKTIWRIPINKLEEGMIISDDYFNSSGLLIAAKGERITCDIIKSLVRFAEAGELPYKILVMK